MPDFWSAGMLWQSSGIVGHGGVCLCGLGKGCAVLRMHSVAHTCAAGAPVWCAKTLVPRLLHEEVRHCRRYACHGL